MYSRRRCAEWPNALKRVGGDAPRPPQSGRNSALTVVAFTIQVGLPGPKRMELGPHWISMRAIAWKSHGTSEPKKPRELSAAASPRTR